MKNNYMPVLTVSEMKKAENNTCTLCDIIPLDLMENAGHEIYRYLREEKQLDMQKKIVIICGPGNNGGDGLVLSRFLNADGYRVMTMIIANRDNMTNEAATNLNRHGKAGNLLFIDDNNKDIAKKKIAKADIIVDAIFGIGINRPVTGLYYEIIFAINEAKAPVYSIDIPSGINGDNGLVMGVAVKADFTLIVQNYKVGNLLNDACDYQGRNVLLDIGIKLPVMAYNRYFLSSSHMLRLIKPRLKNTHKYNYGKTVIFGGNASMTGAPTLAALASLRSGAGLSVWAMYHKYRRYLINRYPEIINKAYRFKEIAEITSKASSLAFGVGLGKKDKINYRILEKLLILPQPLIIDGDGHYYLKKFLNKISNKVIITPHIGELSVLTGLAISDIRINPLSCLKSLVEKYSLHIVFKGPTTIIADKSGMYFYHCPNPGLATAGSGDVLTGIIAGFLAQGYSPTESCMMGVVFHSFAGYNAYQNYGEYGMIASDIIQFLPDAILSAFESNQKHNC